MRTPQPAVKKRLQTIALAFLVLASVAGCARETSDEANARGQSALLAGDYANAVKHLRRAAKLNADNEIVLYNLGMAHLLAKNYKAAQKAFDASDKLNRDNSTDALEGLAQARRLAGDYEGAISAFTRAFDKVNREPHLVAGLAVCHMEQGKDKYEYAKTLLGEALDTDNTDPVALYNMAVLMQKPKMNERAKAAEMYARFISNTRSADYPAQRIRAIEAIQTMNTSRPDDLQMKIDDHLIQARMAKNKANALNHAVEAVKLDRSNPDASLALITTLRAIGHKAQAEMMKKNFLAVFPDDPRGADL